MNLVYESASKKPNENFVKISVCGQRIYLNCCCCNGYDWRKGFEPSQT